ncbi:hypothetical protein BKE38_24580 [Pseudoroseomonas deserti]|uniref:Glycosyltransferase 2-like domain-containing protein n=2 Tax=Teichococcus deserti TaxID=1817963 RepID=A0A1V2GVJ0_9PROT|nr:hypothetical protein BKE38_24580 [Pseudoroseomonas deserti]
MGFPRSVNRGLEERRGRSVVLLNADTVVPDGWLERLTAAAQSKPYVASVTPLSNNATILSYPVMNFENPLDPETQLTEIDGIASKVNDKLTIEVPVGVGFCMYMTAKAIEEVGNLSEEWGRGYGEEVDWCMRARDLGYVHLAAADIFVCHEGSVSFGADTRKKLVAQNGLLLGTKYPDYLRHVVDFVREDPLRLARSAIDLMRIEAVGLPVRVHVTHNFSGGTQVHVREFIARRRGEELGCLLRPYKAADDWGQAVDAVATLRIPDLNIRVYLKESDLVEFLKRVTAHGNLPFILHSALSWNEKLIDKILGNFSYDSVIHDYAWFCPRIQTFHDRTFCGIPHVEKCVQCVRLGTAPQDNQVLSTREGLLGYVARHHALLRNARKISAPSETARAMTLRRFGDLSIEVHPHHEADSAYQIRGIDPKAAILTMGFLGAIGVQKGFDVLRAISREVHERSLPIQLVIIGYTSDDHLLRSENPDLVITGPYERRHVRTLISQHHLDCILLPSLWPETYCYALSDAWSAGVPVVTFDIGATAERLRRFGGGIVLPEGTAWPTIPDTILDHIRSGDFRPQAVDLNHGRTIEVIEEIAVA